MFNILMKYLEKLNKCNQRKFKIHFIQKALFFAKYIWIFCKIYVFFAKFEKSRNQVLQKVVQFNAR